MTVVTYEAQAADWEALGWKFLLGPCDDAPVKQQVDARAPHLTAQDRKTWFKILHTALPVREGDYELEDWPVDARDPHLIETQARADAAEAIKHLIGGAA